MKTQIKIVLTLIALQALFALLCFGGFLLDPLFGLIMVGCYFFIVTSFFMYHYFQRKYAADGKHS